MVSKIGDHVDLQIFFSSINRNGNVSDNTSCMASSCMACSCNRNTCFQNKMVSTTICSDRDCRNCSRVFCNSKRRWSTNSCMVVHGAVCNKNNSTNGDSKTFYGTRNHRTTQCAFCCTTVDRSRSHLQLALTHP